MEKLIEEILVESYIGKPYNEQRYSEVFNKGFYFFPSHCDVQTRWKFNITFSLLWGWEQRNVDFRICLGVKDGMVSSCYIDKRKDNYSGLYVRNPCASLKPTQQELRLFKRIMDYVTE